MQRILRGDSLSLRGISTMEIDIRFYRLPRAPPVPLISTARATDVRWIPGEHDNTYVQPVRAGATLRIRLHRRNSIVREVRIDLSRRGVTRVLVDGAGAAGCRYKINVVSLP